MFESVLLPAPFSPSSACTSPTAASKSTRSFASTPGNDFEIPRIETAGEEASPAAVDPVNASTLGAPLDALDQPVHRVEVVDREPLPFRDAQLALLVVQRAPELVERAVHERALLRGDRRLRLRRDLRAERGEADHPILDRPVVEARLPGAVLRRLHAAQVVRAPVVDRRRQPLLRRELHRVRVVADPWNLRGLRVLPGGG